MSKNDGAPDFPQGQAVGEISKLKGGMSLRDYFAAKALATASAYAAEDVATWDAEDFARHAYGIADAMLAARNT